MNRFILILLALVIPFSSWSLTIEEAVILSLETNNNIKSKEYTVKSKDLLQSSSLLLFMPSFGVQYNYNYSSNQNLASDALSAQFNLSGDYGSIGAYASLNIFNGLSDLYSFQIAKLDKEMAVSQLDAAAYDTILNAQTAYVDVLKATSDLEVAESNLKLLERQKRDAQISADNGLIAKNDLLQTETYLASAQLQVITAKSTLTKAKQNLERQIHRKLSSDEQFVEPVLLNINLESEEVLKEKMFANRSDLKYLEQSYESSKKQEKKSLNGVYPKVDASFNYYSYGEDGNIVGGAALRRLNSNYTFGVTASWNVLSVASSSVQSIAQKRATQSLAYSIADTKQNMILDLQYAIENYYTSKAQLAQSIISVSHAEENYRVTKNLYDQSAATMTDLLDASSKLNEAKVAESNARFSVLSSVYTLERTIQEKLPVHSGSAENKSGKQSQG